MKGRILMYFGLLALAGVTYLAILFFTWINRENEVIPIFFNVNAGASASFQNAMHGNASNVFNDQQIILKSINNIDQQYSIWIGDRLSSNAENCETIRFERFFTTPIVLFAPNQAALVNSGFSILNPTARQSRRFVEIDLRIILNAILNELEWSDIGISMFSGSVSLVIPNETNFSHEFVIAQIYLALNDYNDLTAFDIERLSPYVYTIINRSYLVANTSNYIYSRRSNSNKRSIPVLDSESIIHSIRNDFNTENRNYWMPIYFSRHVEISYDLFINDISDDIVEEIINLLSKSHIIRNTGFRTARPVYELNRQNGYRKAIPSFEVYSLTVEKLNYLSFSKINKNIVTNVNNHEKFFFETSEEIEYETLIEEETNECNVGLIIFMSIIAIIGTAYGIFLICNFIEKGC